MTLSRLEEQLVGLQPASDDELAARILCALETRHCPVPLPTQVFAQVAQPTQHTSCFASGLPILTGIAGGLIGAAVMFFAVTFFMPPRVEIREVVRFVPVAAAGLRAADEKVNVDKVAEENLRATEAEAADKPADKPKPTEPSPRSKPQESRELPWVLAWLSPIFSRDAVADLRAADMMHDLDAMLEQRARLARNAVNMEPRPQFVRFERDNSPPSEFSPIHYREMMDQMSL